MLKTYIVGFDVCVCIYVFRIPVLGAFKCADILDTVFNTKIRRVNVP